MALEQQQVHGGELKSFTEARGEITKDWLKMITDWEEDQERSKAEQAGVLNPYDLPKGGKFSTHDFRSKWVFDIHVSHRYVRKRCLP